MKNKTLLLAILDGWGYREASSTNAITVANTPNMDRWMAEYPFTTLIAHNGLVGLPEGQMGNSEVGHLNIGAGRIVYQDYTRINKAIASGTFAYNTVLSDAMARVKQAGTALHFFGLLSNGGVHSHIDHLKALLEMAATKGLERVYVHCFMDGRDTAPKSGHLYIRELQQEMKHLQCGRIATISGRYWAMDRDNRWNRVKKAWDAIVTGMGIPTEDPAQAVEDAYRRNETDEFITPTVLMEKSRPVGPVQDDDTIIFFNFRADRARELCRAFTEQDFDGFDVSNRPAIRELVTFTEYDREFEMPVAFPPLSMDNILGKVIDDHGLRQLRIAETEKYAHVTYFFNGGSESPFAHEERILIDSPRDVDTYDQKPEMSAFAVTDKLIDSLEKAREVNNPYQLVILNFANGDMVGHTGIMEAAVKACEAVDICLGRIANYLLSQGGTLMITSDHGNAEIMADPESGEPYTAHSLNPVPLILVDEDHRQCKFEDGGALKDIAPTILTLLGLPIPKEMEGKDLLHCAQ